MINLIKVHAVKVRPKHDRWRNSEKDHRDKWCAPVSVRRGMA
jgi:hypothetical protein